MPYRVRLEASTLCQLKCPGCYMRNFDSGTTGIGYLKFGDFKSFIDRHRFIKHVELANSGEIFLNPDLDKIMAYAHDKQVSLTATSGVNFNRVSEATLENLVTSRFAHLTVSIDGASQEVYCKYRVNGHYDTVVENVVKLNAYKLKHNSPLPKLTWQYILMEQNEGDVPKAKELAQKLNMDILFKLERWGNFHPKDEKKLAELTGLKYFNRPDYDRHSTANFAFACPQMWQSPQINFDGRLLGCCMVFEHDYGVNVFEVGLRKALRSRKYAFAKQMLQGKAMSTDDSIPCVNCATYKSICKNNSYIKGLPYL